MRKIQYLVEGENEQAIINAIKGEFIISGKVDVFNCLEKNVSLKIRTIKAPECIIVIDIDVLSKAHKDCLITNANKLQKSGKKVTIISQNRNLEEELIRASNLDGILNMYNVDTIEKHKSKLNKDRDVRSTLSKIDFDYSLFWNTENKIIIDEKVSFSKSTIEHK